MLAKLCSPKLFAKSFVNIAFKRVLCANSNHTLIREEYGDPFDSLTVKDRQIVRLLRSHRFEDSQISRILKHIETQRNSLRDLKPELIQDSINFWYSKFREPLSTLENPKSRDIRHVLSEVEPNLLFIVKSEMEKRVSNIMEIGILMGRNDLLRVFREAPRGYFLQSWPEIMKKFYYFQHIVMEWWLKDSKDPYPTPHPLVKYPKIVETSYEHIKTRYLFSIYTGFKSTSVLTSIEKKEVTLRDIFLDDIDDYLHKVAPFCTDEEYFVFENMVSEMEEEEDEIIKDLAELNGVFKRKEEKDYPYGRIIQKRRKKNRK